MEEHQYIERKGFGKIEDIMLIEPKNVTYAHMSVTAWQLDAITIIMDKLQNVISTDLNKVLSIKELIVEADYNEFGLNNSNRTNLILELEKLASITCKFRWLVDPSKKTKSTIVSPILKSVIFVDSLKLRFIINEWAIPYLLYYGTPIGGTRLNKRISIQMNKASSKYIYKMLCSYNNVDTIDISIEEFKNKLCLDPKYTNSNIRLRHIEPAKISINTSDSDITFKYEFITLRPIKGRKKQVADTIRFFKKQKEILIKDIEINAITEKDNFDNLINKWCEYKKERKEKFEGSISISSFKNKLLKLSDNDFYIAEKIIEQSFQEGYPTIYKLQNNEPIKINSKDENKIIESTLVSIIVNEFEISKKETLQLFTKYSEQHITDHIHYMKEILIKDKDKIKSIPAYFKKALENEYAYSKVSSTKQNNHTLPKKYILNKYECEHAYVIYRDTHLSNYINNLPIEEAENIKENSILECSIKHKFKERLNINHYLVQEEMILKCGNNVNILSEDDYIKECLKRNKIFI